MVGELQGRDPIGRFSDDARLLLIVQPFVQTSRMPGLSSTTKMPIMGTSLVGAKLSLSTATTAGRAHK
jgi:hypothetical protein